jgi:hypothetical protein
METLYIVVNDTWIVLVLGTWYVWLANIFQIGFFRTTLRTSSLLNQNMLLTLSWLFAIRTLSGDEI